MSTIKKFLIASPFWGTLTALAGSASVAFAATSTTVTSPINDLNGIGTMLCNVVGWFIWIVIIVSIIMLVYAAYTYATAGDDTEKVSKGRKIITYAAIGIVVALIATGVPTLVKTFLGSTATSTISCIGF